MNDRPRFDEQRSAAIRSALLDVVEQSPRRDRRRQVRIAVAAVLAALGLGLGGTAVAFAVTGVSLFGDGGVTAAPPTTSAPATAPSTPPATDAAPAPAAHPLVVTGDPIAPHDILTQPAVTPAWSVQLPGAGDMCEHPTVIDVADGYALVEVGPTQPPEDSHYDCDLDASRFSLTLVDTSTGAQVWSRDWSWDFTYGDHTAASLLGTSGRVLVWDALGGPGPKEVLDLATGTTVASIDVPEHLALTTLYPVPGDSGDVAVLAQGRDAQGQPTTSWSVMRADPADLANPRWSVPFEAEQAGMAQITNTSSILQVTHWVNGQSSALDVYDVDSGALMVGATTDRSYSYYDGFTIRASDQIDYKKARTIAGIDDAGNEVWSRSLDSGYSVAPILQIARQPGSSPQLVSEVLLIGPGTQLELVDGVTGESRWIADGAACGAGPGIDGTAVSTYGFGLTADGVVMRSSDKGAVCGFDHGTGAVVDVSQRPSTDFGVSGELAQYRLDGAFGTGGLYSEKGQDAPPSPMPQSGTGTAYDATTGAALWSVPAFYDERWVLAGGYLVGFSQGRVFGIG
ncbi:hypothetical protein [Herbiconiux ginsengi]|uniref:PQQ-like domain-containing protein n=1 Tax=Herbiconiux ginsengi TaxID=381665 RepID=A0A1H3QS68_9MICO|nr:hypothetical protein [Herbiconiux ginsengi]SDZ16442.1 hypothetical protein SAMN05216554_2722 [Herbiconiux ginsengi]